jgi:anti-sigma factor RsiW
MNCEEFQKKFNRMLDGELPPGEAPSVLAHRASCAPCAAYASGIEEADQILRVHGAVEVPATFIEKLMTIQNLQPRGAPSFSWRPFLRKATWWVVAGAGIFLLASFLSVPLQAVAHGAALIWALTLLLLRSLKFAFFLPGSSPGGERGEVKDHDGRLI